MTIAPSTSSAGILRRPRNGVPRPGRICQLVLLPLLMLAPATAQPDTTSKPSGDKGVPPAAEPADPDSPGVSRPCPVDERLFGHEQPALRITALLDAARCALTIEAAPAVSALLHQEAVEPAKIPALDRARSLLKRANAELASLPGTARTAPDSPAATDDDHERPNDTGVPAGERRPWQARLEMLTAFLEGFAALAEHDGSEESRARLIDAAIGLSLYLDDSTPGIASSARLWKAMLYRRAGMPDRALQLLPLNSEPAHPRRIEFILRLERCRALADDKQFVGAIALATRLAGRAESWFAGDTLDARRGAAEDVRRLRADLYRRWAGQLRTEGANDRAVEADATAQRILPPGDASSARLVLDSLIADVKPLGQHARKSPPADTQPTSAPQP